jgi:hypothetical protein
VVVVVCLRRSSRHEEVAFGGSQLVPAGMARKGPMAGLASMDIAPTDRYFTLRWPTKPATIVILRPSPAKTRDRPCLQCEG